MTRQIMIIVAVLAISIAAFGQQFEGKITYKNKYKSKIPNLTDERFNTMLGTTQEYYIKGGNYKSVTNGTLAQWQLYINADNKLYDKRSNTETIFWSDGGVNDDSVISAEIKKNVTEILGHPCDELILTCKDGMEIYYFDSKLGVNTKLFVKHKYGNWYEYLKRTNALPLKMVIDEKMFSMESVAVEIKEMPLDDKIFQLPENAKTEKSAH